MKKIITIQLISILMFGFILYAKAENPCTLNILVNIPASVIPTPTPTPVPGGGGGGAAVAVPVGIAGGGAVAGLGAFAPLLLAGLNPGTVIAAAAPINCVCKKCCFLQTALKKHFNTNNVNLALSKAKATQYKSFFVVNDTNILNGTFDIQDIKLPAKFNNAPKIGFKATIVSSPYKNVAGKPELELRMFKDITKEKLEKRYTSQGFRKKYLMKKYEIPYSSSTEAYTQGLHQIHGVIDKAKIKNPEEPIRTVVSYTEDGFKKNQAVDNPKIKTYAYLIELTALN